MKVVFFCMTALPLFVFAFVYFQIGAFNTALSGALIALALILMLQGFIVFRKMADHIERLSATMSEAEQGKTERVDNAGETRELAIIADTFNRTLSKLEKTARDLGVKTVQASTLYETREILSRTIQMEEVSRIVLERAMKAVNAQTGYLAVRQDGSPKLFVAASSGVPFEMPFEIDLDPEKTLAGLVLSRRSPILIEDIEQDEWLKNLNRPDMGVPRFVYLSVAGKDTPIGTLAMGRKRGNPHFDQDDVQFLETLLQQVAYNFENAKLYQDLMRSNKDLEIALDAQKRAQDQLLASARMAAFGELSVSIANELNNPLTGILGFANLLLTSSDIKDGEARGYLEMIQSQALRAGQITRSLMDIVSDKPGSRISTDINGLLRKSLTLLKARMSDSGIKLTLRLADNPHPVTVDPAQIEHVFFSILSNAMNALTGVYSTLPGPVGERPGTKESKPSLMIGTEQRKGKVYISFRDNGPGIAPEDLPRIFDPFYSTQEKVTQVGLGLWVSQRIVKIHMGTIQVRSAPGKGSLFVVVLPATEEK
ncbi:MAG: GAF domain-containing protein [Deltaproteobacteria bacterium]|nr:GAF domain-containing protein [Deltaproteobacteria bacterium]